MPDPRLLRFSNGKDDKLKDFYELSMNNNGPNAICARLMKESSPIFLQIINEEFQKNPTDCLIGLMSFYVNINTNIIMQTIFREDSEGACELFKKIFINIMDQVKPLMRDQAGKKPN